MGQDTYKGSAWSPWTQHLYAYVGNNPVNYVDPTGHMPRWAIRALEGIYSSHEIPTVGMSMAVIGANMAPGTGGNLFTAFHEIAQLNIARQLGGAQLEVKLKGTVADVIFGSDTVDVEKGGQVWSIWEVKPLGGESPLKQLNKAVAQGYTPGAVMSPIANIQLVTGLDLYMRVDFPAPGQAKYSFYRNGADGNRVRVETLEAAASVAAFLAAIAATGAAGSGSPAPAPGPVPAPVPVPAIP